MVSETDATRMVEALRAARLKLRALAIGEAIEDTYRYVQPVGRATKDPIVTWAGNAGQSWRGGTEAVANHLRGLVADVQIETTSPLEKVRYVEQPFGRKVMSVVAETRIKDTDSLSWNYQPVGMADLVVVTDYGHGFWDNPKKIDRCLFQWRQVYGDPMVALNVQANSLNWGLSTLNKWPNADYIVCNENELRLACQDPTTHRSKLAPELRERLRAKALAVTLGHQGAEMYFDGGVVACPAFTLPGAVVDRMGAGDAFLSASAPIIAMGCEPADALRIGSVAAALAVRSIGNDLRLTTDILIEEIEKMGGNE